MVFLFPVLFQVFSCHFLPIIADTIARAVNMFGATPAIGLDKPKAFWRVLDADLLHIF